MSRKEVPRAGLLKAALDASSKTRRVTLRARSRMSIVAEPTRGASRFIKRVSTRTPSASSEPSVG